LVVKEGFNEHRWAIFISTQRLVILIMGDGPVMRFNLIWYVAGENLLVEIKLELK
jgi:hypothetical protein|tara:strand:- start:2453 stop:2617 length:165 start_codon:yes stop_codon:yes gene_type:complete